MKVDELNVGQVFKINSVHKILRYSTNTCSNEWAKKLAGLTCQTQTAGESPRVTFQKEIDTPFGYTTGSVYLGNVDKNNFVKELIQNG